MTIEKQPFTSYTLDEDRKDPYEVGKVFTVRLNGEEYADLKKEMRLWNIPSEGKMLKLHAKVGRHVLHSILGAPLIKWFRAPTRRKEEPE